ncbi:hypothetical protein QTI24_28945 [Variovorax sp. J22P240]|uniref:hypothetical protein n=1 Tax=Variovorax sp. J22P240 TaxID=3053514 RepID=UPI002574F336|nr:hypothetical protein [Variovorax sp. J22P240]MDM0002659.1 hypothetical protein [Variovorax sp. J22P240]
MRLWLMNKNRPEVLTLGCGGLVVVAAICAIVSFWVQRQDEKQVLEATFADIIGEIGGGRRRPERSKQRTTSNARHWNGCFPLFEMAFRARTTTPPT